MHVLGLGVRNCSHSARSDPLPEPSESMERAREATSAEGIARCVSRGILGRTREGRVHERDTDLYKSVTPLAPVSCDQTANCTHAMGNKEESVMRIGMIEAGAQGGTLAKQLAKAGHDLAPNVTLLANSLRRVIKPFKSRNAGRSKRIAIEPGDDTNQIDRRSNADML